MKVPNLMTAGPTYVRDNVKLARALDVSNPDLDNNFFNFYKEVCEEFSEILNTKNEVRILCGEAILGLEASCASLIEKGDKVLVIDNGIYGNGFKDFVELYGGEVVHFKGDRKKPINIEELSAFLQNEKGIKYGTLVHCDTPTGIVNDVNAICKLLDAHGIISIVDAVSSFPVEDLNVDESKIDIAVIGSQKCLSACPGLTILSISNRAFEAMEKRETRIPSFYCNLLLWKDYYVKKSFPYTLPINDILSLKTSLNNIHDIENFKIRHNAIGEALRLAIKNSGLKLFCEEGFSNTVTSIVLPDGIEDRVFRNHLLTKFNLMISGSLDEYEGKLIRIGHMGENCYKDKISYTLLALEKTFAHFGVFLKSSLANDFISYFEKLY